MSNASSPRWLLADSHRCTAIGTGAGTLLGLLLPAWGHANSMPADDVFWLGGLLALPQLAAVGSLDLGLIWTE